MPIYEYECRKCKRTFEYMQSLSDAPRKKCERCGGKLDKRISSTGFILKGGGWYKDLYASPRPGPAAEKGEKAEAKGEKGEKGEAKADKAGEKPAAAKPAAERPAKTEKKGK